jgi:hypothetical protein
MWIEALAGLLTLGFSQQSAEPDLSWLEGRWLHCGAGGYQVVEVWTGVDGMLLGSRIAALPRWGPYFSQMRVMDGRAAPGGFGASYFMRLQIEPETELEYALTSVGARTAVFVNQAYNEPDFDMPYRIEYLRDEDILTITSEDSGDGGLIEDPALVLTRAPFGENCEDSAP